MSHHWASRLWHVSCSTPSYSRLAAGDWESGAVAKLAVQDRLQLQGRRCAAQHWLPRWRLPQAHPPSHVPCRNVSSMFHLTFRSKSQRSAWRQHGFFADHNASILSWFMDSLAQTNPHWNYTGFLSILCLQVILTLLIMLCRCVPYGDPLPPFNKKLAFDAGLPGSFSGLSRNVPIYIRSSPIATALIWNLLFDRIWSHARKRQETLIFGSGCPLSALSYIVELL